MTRYETEHQVSQSWHVRKEGRQFGPFSADQLLNLVKSARLRADDPVRLVGSKEWVAASTIKGLFPELLPALPVPQPVQPAPLLQAISVPQPTVIPIETCEVKPAVANVERDDARINYPPNRPAWHQQRIGILIASCIGIVSTFLPWIYVPVVGVVLGTAGDGWITLVLFLPAAACALHGDKSKAVRGINRLGSVFPAVLSGAMGVQKIWIIFKIKAERPRDDPFSEIMARSTQAGVGLYLLVCAGLAVLIVAWSLDNQIEDRST